MIDHTTCRRAVLTEEMAVRGVALSGVGEVRCCACGEQLGTWAARPAGVVIAWMRGDLVRRPVEHDGLRTYGLPDRVRLRGNPRRGTTQSLASVSGTGVTEVYVYCPNPACGRGQHAGRLPSP